MTVKAKARRPKPGRMNKLEAAWAEQLEIVRTSGNIASWQYEAVKLRLAKATWYTPDFMVVRNDGELEFHEVKGFWRDDARVKIKVAAAAFPEFVFFVITKPKGRWVSEVVGW